MKATEEADGVKGNAQNIMFCSVKSSNRPSRQKQNQNIGFDYIPNESKTTYKKGVREERGVGASHLAQLHQNQRFNHTGTCFCQETI